ncbi:hypothetical protein D9756_009241 [Leucocoprinus leucothites]|uniref:Uncharacterized protein n=1 Tax=Leucocoprinus leucothites TaxID=201217 RepID=A0A8H5D0J8_9AGAR|nr:hypothetical protein D9756_009241 [Leucoagaricus leucothites]
MTGAVKKPGGELSFQVFPGSLLQLVHCLLPSRRSPLFTTYTMRGFSRTLIALAFQLTFLGLAWNMFQGVAVQASAIELREVESAQVVKRSIWNNLMPRGSWHEIEVRQVSSGNRTKDLYAFFSPDQPPSECSLQCELIWGAVSEMESLIAARFATLEDQMRRGREELANQLDEVKATLEEVKRTMGPGVNSVGHTRRISRIKGNAEALSAPIQKIRLAGEILHRPSESD